MILYMVRAVTVLASIEHAHLQIPMVIMTVALVIFSLGRQATLINRHACALRDYAQ